MIVSHYLFVVVVFNVCCFLYFQHDSIDPLIFLFQSPVKLNLGYQASMGAVMVYQQNSWTLICDNGLNQGDAMVVCRMFGYAHGTFLRGSKFGSVDAQIGITNVSCHGRESDFMKCPYDISAACPSQKYASVICSNDPIVEESKLKGFYRSWCKIVPSSGPFVLFQMFVFSFVL